LIGYIWSVRQQTDRLFRACAQSATAKRIEITYCARELGLQSRFDGSKRLRAVVRNLRSEKVGNWKMKKTALAIATFAALSGSAIAADKSLFAELR
jgi:hypothetical protein